MIEELLKKMKMEDSLIEDNERYYYDGIPVPRVTELLSSMLHEDYLMKWANAIGLYKRIKYEEEMNIAANIGTYTHESIEQYLQNKDFKLDLSNERNYRIVKSATNAVNSFMEWYKDVTSCNSFEIIGQEQKLSSPWFGGTYDLLAKIDGKIFLIDFKTSNHVGYKYFLQLAAYRYMIYNSLNINIDGCLILQLSKKEIRYDEYVLDFNTQEHYEFIHQCETTFLSLVYAYYNRVKTENMFNNIF